MRLDLLTSDLYDAGATLYHLSYQANSELGIIWVDDRHIDYGYISGYISKCMM